MNTCPKCGVDNPAFNDICRLCETPLRADVASSSSAELGATGVESAAPSAQPTPPPTWLRIFGVLSVLLGVAIPALNYYFVKEGIDKFVAKGFSEAVVLPLWINIWVFTAIGAYLVLSGLGLLGPTLWGRRLSMFFVGIAVVGAVVAMVNGTITKVLAEQEFREMHANSLFAVLNIQYFAAAPLFPPGYGVLLLIFSLLPSVRDWARGTRAVARGLPPAQAWAPTVRPAPVHAPAMISMVLSMVPFLFITQIVSLIMGIVALRTIKRSAGKLGGKGFAWTGVIISTLILGCMGSIISLALVAAAVMPHSADEEYSQPQYYNNFRGTDTGWPADRDAGAERRPD